MRNGFLPALASVAFFLAVVALVFFVCYRFFSFLYGLSEEPVPSSWREDKRKTDEKYWHDVEERELRFERFAAWTECPKCLVFDLHPIKDTLPHSCRRECTKCKYVWRQI